MSILLVGNGNVAASIGADLHRRNQPFKWFRPDESGRYLIENDIDAALSVILIAVSDQALLRCLEMISGNAPNATLIHFSGSLRETDVPQPVQSRLVRFHPMYSFPDKQILDLSQIPFLLDGPKTHSTVVKDLFPHVAMIESSLDAPEAYHLMGVFACNFMVGLFDIMTELGRENPISPAEQKRLMRPIIERTVANFFEQPRVIDALSGPVKRGDIATLARHRSFLQSVRPDLLPIYDAMTDYLRRMVSRTH